MKGRPMGKRTSVLAFGPALIFPFGMRLRNHTGLFVAAALAASTLDGASGWEAYIAYEGAPAAEYEDLQTAPHVEETRWVAGVQTFNRNRSGQLAFDASLERLDADWNRSFFSGLEGVLYDEVEMVDLSGMWTGTPGEHWGYTLYAGVESNRATGGVWNAADFTDAIGYRLGFGLNYQVHRGLVFGFGVLYKAPMAEIDEDWIPMVRVYWRINDNWTLETRNGILLHWKPHADGNQEFRFFGLWEGDEWHLGEEEGRVYGYEREAIALGLGYKLVLGNGLSLKPVVQYEFNREVNIWESGRETIESDLETGLRYGLQIGYAF